MRIVSAGKISECGMYRALLLLIMLSAYTFYDQRPLAISVQVIFIIATVFFLKKINIKETRYLLWKGAFVIWSLPLAYYAVNPNAVVHEIFSIGWSTIICFGLMNFVKDECRLHILLKYVVIACVFLILRVFLMAPIENIGVSRLGTLIGQNSNSTGMAFAYGTIISLYFANELKNKKYYIFAIIFIAMALLTGSKKAFFLLVGGISLLLLLHSKKIKTVIRALLISIVFIVLLYNAIINIPVLYDLMGIRLERAFLIFSGDNADASTMTRFAMMKEAIDLFKQKPLSGYGLENFRVVSVFGTYSHNNYLEILVSTGVIGFMIYYSLPIYLLISSFIKWLKGFRKYSIVIVFVLCVLLMDVAAITYRSLATQILIALSFKYYLILNTQLLQNKRVTNPLKAVGG